MDPCPSCGKNDFKSTSGRTLHLKGCEGAKKLIQKEEKPVVKRKSAATFEHYQIFNKKLLKVVENLTEAQTIMLDLSVSADAIGHDGFATFAKYFSQQRLKDLISNISAYSQAYNEDAFKESKKPKPWDRPKQD